MGPRRSVARKGRVVLPPGAAFIVCPVCQRQVAATAKTLRAARQRVRKHMREMHGPWDRLASQATTGGGA